MRKNNLALLSLMMLVLVLGSGLAQCAGPVVVTADFAVTQDYPLSKDKFAVFNSGLVPLERYERDIHLYDEVSPESLRIDLWWGGGGWKRQPVSGTPDSVHYDWAEMDRLATLLNTHGVFPYWAYCYVPEPLQDPLGDAKTNFQNYTLWGEILGSFARHASSVSQATRIGYHEIYNEPDNYPEFYKGKLHDYLKMYHAGVRAIQDADPDALVGGPGLAFNDTWVLPFLDYVSEHGLPLDFFSYHYYPTKYKGFYPRVSTPPSGIKSIQAIVEAMRRDLSGHPEFATTESHLNEYNSYRIDYPKGGRQDRYALASAMLHDYRYFLSQPDLTRVHWAQFMDSGYGNYSGMISIEGHRKALFNAYSLYARMPIDRRQLSVQGSAQVEGLASSGAHQAALLLWNCSGEEQILNVGLNHVPFARGTLRVYRIDVDHASWGDNPANETLCSAETRKLSSATFAWSGPIPSDGVVYLEVEDGSGLSERKVTPVARVLRVLHYYPDRASQAYADFDRQTWTARLGMASEKRAEAHIGAVVESLPAMLAVSVQTEGILRSLDPNSLLGVRLDYQAKSGAYTQSVLYHGPCSTVPDIYNEGRNAAVPWGTKRHADHVVEVRDLAHWTGRLQVSFILQNTGPNTRAKMWVTRP